MAQRALAALPGDSCSIPRDHRVTQNAGVPGDADALFWAPLALPANDPHT